MVSESLARCLAKLCGDGHVSPKYLRYNNTCPVLLTEFEDDMAKEFGNIHFTKGNVNSGVPFAQVQKREIINFMLAHLTSFKSDDIHIPNLIKSSSLSVKISFIRAFYDDEGSVALRFKKHPDEWKRSITLCSNSLQILLEIKEFLLSLGIRPNKIYRTKPESHYDKSFILSITGRNNFLLFREKIGFKHPKKAAVLNLLIASYGATPIKSQVKCNEIKKKLNLCRSHCFKKGQLSGSPTRKCSTPRNVCVLNSLVDQVQIHSEIETGSGVPRSYDRPE
jgi:hypothetical protein